MKKGKVHKETITWFCPGDCQHKWEWLSKARIKKDQSCCGLAPTKWCRECGSITQLLVWEEALAAYKKIKVPVPYKIWKGAKWKEVKPNWRYGLAEVQIRWETPKLRKGKKGPKKVSNGR